MAAEYTSVSLSTADRAAKVRFRRALALMAMTLVLPGSAQLACGNKSVGRAALRIWFALLMVGAGCLVAAALHHEFAFWLVSDLAALQTVRIALMALAVGWAALFFDAWRIGQPLTLRMSHRRAAVGINGILCFSVAAVLLFGAHLVGVQRDFIQTMFGSGDASGAHDGRYNVLLLGGDSGVDRWGLRPDSITVASIDAETGRTVLVSLPRNMQNFPFAKGSVMHEQFPQGFDCEHCMLNGVNTWAMDNTELFGKAENPGIDATISAVEGITGLKINYWAMVNLKGFRDLVDAVGGVTLNVRQRIPIGGLGSDVYDYIEPGQAEAHRLPDPVVRASPRRLRRLLPDGAAEVRDGRDARPARPDRRAQELPEDRQGELRHGADEHPGRARSTASSGWRSRRVTRRSRRSRSCRRSSTPTSRTPS